MSVSFASGAEGQAISIDNVTLNGTSSYNTNASFVRTGAASFRCNPASGASGFVSFSGSSYHHFALYIATLPSLDRRICGPATSLNINLRLTSTGNLAVYVFNTLIGTSSIALSTGQWYWIGLRMVTGTDVTFLQVDGGNEVIGTATANAAGGTAGAIGTEASAVDLYIDDITSETAGLLAPSKVDIALPISDNTVTAVTGGAGGTTDLWDAVNNTPPAGVASASETDTTNIRFPASQTENYIAALETYTTLGIVDGDAVISCRSIVRHGEDIATGTKTMQNCGALTNPTVVGANVTFGSDGGAHGAETGLWVTTFGGIAGGPSVTLGTSPTIRASRVSESRVGCIDFMGMLVVWTPGATAGNPRYRSTYPQLLAH